MNIIFVEDEINSQIAFRNDIKAIAPNDCLTCFSTAEDALSFAEKNKVDCAFLDIDLGYGMSGLDLAKYLKAIKPNIEIAFLTACDDYTRQSYKLGGRAYITKPYLLSELKEALSLIKQLVSPCYLEPREMLETPYVKSRSFGNFDLMIDDCSVPFKTAKAKEALAFLVDQMGGSVSGAEIFFALWENQEYNSSTSAYVRRTMRALKDELKTLGIQDILITNRNNYSIDIKNLYCDNFALLNGSLKEASLYNGEYMRQYSWSENTIPLLDRAAQKILESKPNVLKIHKGDDFNAAV